MKKGFDRGRNRAPGGPTGGPDAEAIAIGGLRFIAGNPDHLERFLGATGLEPDTLRRAAASPEFLTAVLDHIVGDESLLIAFAAQTGTDPAIVVEAQAHLSRAGTVCDPTFDA